MRVFLYTVSFLSISQPQSVYAFWRLACSVSQTARIDPILNPGGLSGHVHKFAGGNNVDSSSNHDSLLASSCSSCQVQSDKSAYWTPQLYYQHGNGNIEEVPNDGMTVYYVGRGGDASNTRAFPPGFKMITGNSLLRHYDSSILTYQNRRPVADRTHYLNKTNCANGLRAQINFQSCWDGVNPYKSDQSHVAYLSGIDYGSCPPTHPVSIPGLFFEVLYWSNRVDQTDGGRFVFSNGDTTGYGFHADFLNGWDQDVQTQAVQQCLYADNNGVVDSCAPLQKSNDVNFARTCPESGSVLTEAVRGLLPTNNLPGCNPITLGPIDATQVVCAVNSTIPLASTPSPSSPSSNVSTILPSASPGGFFSGSATTFSTITTLPNVATNSSVSSNLTLSAVSTTQQNISTTTPARVTGTKIVTISVANFTTIAIEVPASLDPKTSYSNLAEATSYVDALISIASEEAHNRTATSAPASTTIPDPGVDSNPETYDVTITDLVTITLPASESPSPSAGPGQFFSASNPSNISNVFITGTKTKSVTIFNPTVTLEITSTLEVTVTATPAARMFARGVQLLKRRWHA